MTEQRLARLATAAAYHAGYNAADAEAVLACYAPDAVLEEVGSGRSHRGEVELRAGLNGFLSLFADLHFRPDPPIAAGDSLLCPYVMTARVQRDLGPARLAGREVTLRGAHLLEFRGAQIGRCRDFWDFEELVAQAA